MEGLPGTWIRGLRVGRCPQAPGDGLGGAEWEPPVRRPAAQRRGDNAGNGNPQSLGIPEVWFEVWTQVLVCTMAFRSYTQKQTACASFP